MNNNGIEIKTYSRLQPVVLCKKNVTLVPKYPERTSKVRESQLNEKTLVVDAFDDTFDRLAADIVIPVPNYTLAEDSNISNTDTVFKVPQQTNRQQRTYEKNLKPKKQKVIELCGNENLSKNNKIKRKRLNSKSSDDEDDISDDTTNIKSSKEKTQNSKKKKKKESPAKNKVEVEHNIDDNSLNENQLDDRSSKTTNNFLISSTPLDRRPKLFGNMHSISPITLLYKENEDRNTNKDGRTNKDELKEKSILRELNFSSLPEELHVTNLKSQNILSHSQENDELENIKTIEDVSAIENIHKSHLKDSKISSENAIPDVQEKLISIKNNKSSDKSPLLFNDTSNNETVLSKEISFGSISKNNKLSCNHNNSKENICNNSKNESSFYPDDWTNDYNSSYEYSAQKECSNHTTKTEENVLKQASKINTDSEDHSLLEAEVKDKTVNNENEMNTDKNIESSSHESKTEKPNNDIVDSCLTAKKADTNSNNNQNENLLSQSTSLQEVATEIENYNINNSISTMLINEDKTYAPNEHVESNINEENIPVQITERKKRKRSAENESNTKRTSKKRQTKNVEEINTLKPGTNKVDNKHGEIHKKKIIVLVSRLREKLNKAKQQPIYQNKKLDTTSWKELRVLVSRLDVDNIKTVLPGSSKETTGSDKTVSENLQSTDLQESLEIDKSNTNTKLRFRLLNLKDPIKITTKKNTYKKSLAAISEDHVENSLDNNKSLRLELNDSDINEDVEKNTSNDGKHNNSVDARKSQPVFLKPGKSWARSLSIINHFHNGQNLEEMADGRGKNWRNSVQTILNMQSDGISQKSFRESDGKKSSVARISNRISTVTISPSRYSRRFSMRIVPSGKRSTLTNDLISSPRSSLNVNKSRKTSVSRKTSRRITRDSVIETEDDLIKSAKEIVLKRCNQTSYLPFEDCFPDLYIECCRKIGEGVYGEVFLYEKDDKKSVIKIIPIEGEQLVNSEPQKKFHEILSEIIIAEELHKLRFGDTYHTDGFVEVNRIMCVIGKYPDKLIDLWNLYDEEKNSENDSPAMFDNKQLYIILELAHGGQDLEAYVFQNAAESYSIFLQTAYSLAVAEKSLEFEHRDLHWGNILISKTEDQSSHFKLNNNEISLPTKGVKVSVIDFTLSRMLYRGCKIFNDLSVDPTLFTAQGEYQFDIYRLMRDSVMNDWQQFNPFTNVLWLDYTLDKMINGARYKKKTTKIHKNAVGHMKELRKVILNYKSAYEFVNSCDQINL